MARISYDTAADEIQSLVRGQLASDLVSFTKNVYDGLPPKLAEGHGYPYVIVHTPSIDEDMFTFHKVKLSVRVTIEVYSIKEGNVRQGIDRVRKSLYDAKDTFRYTLGRGLRNYRWSSGEPNVTPLSDNQNEWMIRGVANFMLVVNKGG